MPVLSTPDRLRLRQLYVFRCGYYGISESETGAELTEDHFQPAARGGLDSFENIVYACHICNEFKGAVWNPDSDERILHPLNEDYTIHYSQASDGSLRLNRPGLVANRQMKLRANANDEQMRHVRQDWKQSEI